MKCEGLRDASFKSDNSRRWDVDPTGIPDLEACCTMKPSWRSEVAPAVNLAQPAHLAFCLDEVARATGSVPEADCIRSWSKSCRNSWLRGNPGTVQLIAAGPRQDARRGCRSWKGTGVYYAWTLPVVSVAGVTDRLPPQVGGFLGGSGGSRLFMFAPQ